MSAPAFAWAMERGATLKLKPADRLVLLYLADMANGEKVCWPGQETIEKFTGLSPKTVRVALQRLQGIPLIRVEATAGYASRYHILRPDTPANGAHPTPANGAQVTPANGAHPPRQNVPRGVGTIRPDGGHDLPLTPANGAHDPFSTQVKKPLDARDAREGKQAKDSDFSEKASKPAAAPPPPPVLAPVLGATPGGTQTYVQPRSSDAYLADPSPDDALPKAEADPLDAPVDPARALAALAEMRHALRMKAYPPRAAVLSRDEQMALCEGPPRPKASYFTREQINAALRVQMLARSGASP